MSLSFLSIAVGFLLLTGAAEALVYGAASLARRIGLSPLVIGLTVVSIGTSLPELVVGLEAALGGTEGMALGNVVGSNVGNLALILGVSALAKPLTVQAQIVRVEGPILIVVSIAFVGLALDGMLGRIDGLVLAGGVVAYVVYNLWAAKTAPCPVEGEFDDGVPAQHRLIVDLGALLVGFLGLMGGAHLLVTGAISIAELLGVGPIVIGLTVVAVGTSLPELATSVVAARRGQGDIAVGNALGSSVFNLLGVLGVTALVHPLSTQVLGWIETAFMMGLAVLIIPLFRTDWTLSRAEGAVLVACYVVYIALLVGL